MGSWLDRNISIAKGVADVVLIAKAKRGDRDAFGKLYLLYLPGIYRYIFFRIGQRHEDAEDLAQTVLVHAWEALGSFSIHKGSFRVWLYTIAHNALVDYYRKETRRPTSAIGEEIPDKTSRGASPEEGLIVSDLVKEVSGALKELSDEHKQVVILRHIESMSFAEIAQITGKREDAMRALHHRALTTLRKLLRKI